MICRYYVVRGRVQGVFYRASAQEQAAALALLGWVRNRADGAVELVACGDETQLVLLENWLWQGPPLAKVEAVEASEADPESSQFDHFHIRY